MTSFPVSGPPTPAEHAQSVSGMFGRIAGWYDFLNHSLSLGQDYYWRNLLVRFVRPGPTGRVLDLAAGTMDVTLELARRHPSLRVVAMDFSLPMLAKGRLKIRPDIAPRLSTVLADGRFLPLADESVDAVTIAFGIRNIAPRQAAFAEMLRVLAPGGRACVLEFGGGGERIWNGLYALYLQKILPAVGRLVSGDKGAYRYLSETILAFPTPRELALEMQQAGFGRVLYRPLLSGIVTIHVAEKAAARPQGEENPGVEPGPGDGEPSAAEDPAAGGGGEGDARGSRAP